jgi:hypothetical protein
MSWLVCLRVSNQTKKKEGMLEFELAYCNKIGFFVSYGGSLAPIVILPLYGMRMLKYMYLKLLTSFYLMNFMIFFNLINLVVF